MQKHLLLVMILALALFNCKSQTSEQMAHKYTNDLINETSPYLLQHAHNPVNWKAWNDNTLAEAKASNKLILISVGYSACHWCHVMEHESFEDTLVAQVMNDKFVNIKVDREERPDVDQVYMNAVQLMTGSGGWPLNVIALPDGRPVWGGTYFRKNDWMNALNQISTVYNDSPEKLYEYADKLEEGIKSMDLVSLNSEEANFKKETLADAVDKWTKSFDRKKGGLNRAPKFMMPNNYHFLMRYAYQNNDDELLEYVNTTLTQMAYGGVYDQIGGGFSRYSVDDKWHVPHFEKMLYDNAQLVSFYSDAYLLTKNELYKSVVYETLAFVERELRTDDGIFYSSLDADSLDENGELEEGAYYVWQKEELKQILGEDLEVFSDYFNINNYGLWEKGNYVLIRRDTDEEIAKKHDISVQELRGKLASWKKTLLDLREKRSRPRLDDKSLTSWNALMLKAYSDAYRVFNEEAYLEAALKNANFIADKQLKGDGSLYHSYKDGKSTINGYLEDYATTIEAFITLYENTFDEKWLNKARDLSNYTFDHFFDDTNKMFFFTSDEDVSLVTRNVEYRDNVIPASNSIMAKNLFKLSHYFDNESYANTAKTMLNNISAEMESYPSSFSNWLDLMLNYTNNYYEVAIAGTNAFSKIHELNETYVPNKILAATETENEMPLLLNRFNDDETMIFVCVNKACKLPVSEVEDALKLIDK